MAMVLFALLVDIRSRPGVTPVTVLWWKPCRLANSPARGVGLAGIAEHRAGFGVPAPRTFEAAMLEA